MIENEKPNENGQHDSVQRLYFIRHAKKEITGEISEEGRRDSSHYFDQLLASQPISRFEVFHSPISRSKDTARIIANSASSALINEVFELEGLTEYPYTDENIEKYNLSGGLWLEEENYTDKLPSTKVMAANIANIILCRIENVNSEGDRETQSAIFVSHIPPLMLFLRHYFEDELGLRKGNVLYDLGGFLQPLHGFTIDIRKADDNKSKLSLNFERTRDGDSELLVIPFGEEKLKKKPYISS